MKLITGCDPPPIPIREMDWFAYDDNNEEVVGYGRTEFDAIVDFVQERVFKSGGME